MGVSILLLNWDEEMLFRNFRAWRAANPQHINRVMHFPPLLLKNCSSYPREWV